MGNIRKEWPGISFNFVFPLKVFQRKFNKQMTVPSLSSAVFQLEITEKSMQLVLGFQKLL